MQSIPESPVLTHLPDTIEAVRKVCNLDQPGRMEEAIDRLQEWIAAQPHFNKKDFDRHFLEMFIINSRGLVERAKQRIENHCVMKTIGKKYFTSEIRPIDLKDLDDTWATALPKLTKDYRRIVLQRSDKTSYVANSAKSFCIFNIISFEAMIKYNYCTGLDIIFDWRNTDLLKLASLVAYEDSLIGAQIFMKAYTTGIQNLHVISDSKVVHAIFSAFKLVLSPKIINRTMFHKDLESLYKYIDKDLLPADYGGKEKPLNELAADWDKFVSTDEHAAYCDESFKATIDFTKKPKEEFNDIDFGVAGTFRSLQID